MTTVYSGQLEKIDSKLNNGKRCLTFNKHSMSAGQCLPKAPLLRRGVVDGEKQ